MGFLFVYVFTRALNQRAHRLLVLRYAGIVSQWEKFAENPYLYLPICCCVSMCCILYAFGWF